MNEILKYGIYARKSETRDERQVLSIDAQISEAKITAKKLGILGELPIYTDTQSAHEPDKRKGFINLMQDLQAGVVNAILVWKPDRLARNMVEGGSIIYMLQNSVIKEIRSPYVRYLPTDNTLPLTIELGMANQYSLDLSVNVKRGNKEKLSKGGYCGMAPHGYLNDVVDKTIVPDPDRFELVRRMWDLMLTGVHSLSDICSIANEDWGFVTKRRKKIGGTPISKSSLHHILMNPFYYGWIKRGEQSNWGSHTPMVTQVEFEKVQNILHAKGFKAVLTKEFAFTGFISCGECGCAITAEEKVKYKCPSCKRQNTAKNPRACRCGHKLTLEDIANGKFYEYHRCTKKKGKCSQKYVSTKKLEVQIDSVLETVEMDEDFEQWAMKWFKVINEERFGEKKKMSKKFQKEYDEADVRIKNLIDMRASGELSKEEFAEMKCLASEEKNRAKERLASSEKRDDVWITALEEKMNFADGIRKKFREGSIKQKRFIAQNIGSNFVLMDGKLSLDVDSVFLKLKDVAEVADLSLEPSQIPSGVSIEELSKDERFTWLPR